MENLEEPTPDQKNKKSPLYIHAGPGATVIIGGDDADILAMGSKELATVARIINDDDLSDKDKIIMIKKLLAYAAEAIAPEKK